MEKSADAYLLYEYTKKFPYTVRMKVTLDAHVDETHLIEAAQEAMSRLPYFSVRVVLDDGCNYVIVHNDAPVPVLRERDVRLRLGSEELSGHLFAITWRSNDIWFNFSHSVCGAFGAMFWVKATLYQYLSKLHGEIEPPRDLKRVGTSVSEAELAWPVAWELPRDASSARYEGGDSNVGLDAFIKYVFNPLVRDNYYYQVEVPSDALMGVAREMDGSPNSLMAAILLKSLERVYPRKKGDHLSVKIAADYRGDVGCPDSYRDFVRFIHVKYDWNIEDLSVAELNARAREAIRLQRQPELSYEAFRAVAAAHEGIDIQCDLESKKRFAGEHSLFRTDVRDTGTVSYVGQQDWGGLAAHVRSVYTITDGNNVVEVNALPDKFCVGLNLLSRKPRLLDVFCEVLEEVGLPFVSSGRFTRYLPEIDLPNG